MRGVPAGLREVLLEVLPGAAREIDERNVVPRWLIERLWDEGAFDFKRLGLRGVIEAVRLAARHSRGVAHVILVHNSGEMLLGGSTGIVALSITEPGGGSDLRANLKTVARGGEEARLSGVKVFTSNAAYAEEFLVLAVGEKGPTLYAARRHESMRIEPLDLAGFRGSGVARVEYRDTPARLAGEPGNGIREALRAINFGRLGYAAIALGMADRALGLIVEASKDKVVFGAKLLDLQGPRWMISSIYYKARVLEAAVEKALEAAEATGDVDPEMAAAAKLMAGELAREAAWAASQLSGGRGLVRWVEAESLYRDAKVIDVGEGAREVIMDFMASRALKRAGYKP